MAPTRSAFSEKPHSTQANCASLLRFSLEICPHPGQGVRVICGGTGTNRPPVQIIMYSICRRNSPHPCSRMDLLSPVFCWTCLPGCSTVPAADRDILRTSKFRETLLRAFSIALNPPAEVWSYESLWPKKTQSIKNARKSSACFPLVKLGVVVLES